MLCEWILFTQTNLLFNTHHMFDIKNKNWNFSFFILICGFFDNILIICHFKINTWINLYQRITDDILIYKKYMRIGMDFEKKLRWKRHTTHKRRWKCFCLLIPKYVFPTDKKLSATDYTSTSKQPHIQSITSSHPQSGSNVQMI